MTFFTVRIMPVLYDGQFSLYRSVDTVSMRETQDGCMRVSLTSHTPRKIERHPCQAASWVSRVSGLSFDGRASVAVLCRSFDHCKTDDTS